MVLNLGRFFWREEISCFMFLSYLYHLITYLTSKRNYLSVSVDCLNNPQHFSLSKIIDKIIFGRKYSFEKIEKISFLANFIYVES